jgi:arylsulfatase A-like enzyme
MRLACLIPLCFALVLSAQTKPNIVLIVADDLGWAGVGFHAKAMTTPRLDRLAKEGTELGRFYVYPLCSPTRAALLTGQTPRRFNIVSALRGRDLGVPAGQPTLPATLKAAGYRTSLIGKWHVGKAMSPQQSGFEHFYGFLNAEIDYNTHTGMSGAVDWQRDGKTLNEEGYSTYLMADDAVRQLKARDKTKPFFLQINFNAAHTPLSAPADILAKHKSEGEKLGLYNAVVEAMDTGIGRVIDALDAEGLRANTVVIFISDNGAAPRLGGSNLPLRSGKDTIFEGGIRTPAIVRWPGKVAAGAVLAQPISVQDLYATITAIAGTAPPSGARIDGVNQWPAILGNKLIPREPFIVASYDIALVDGDWKLIELQAGERLLYNLKDDPSEASNLAKSKPEMLARLGAKLDVLKKDLPAAPIRTAGPGSGGSSGSGAGSGRGPQKR